MTSSDSDQRSHGSAARPPGWVPPPPLPVADPVGPAPIPAAWPPPPPIGPAAGPLVLVPPQGRLSDDEARAARLAVPYLGPDPAPSGAAGKVIIGLMVMAILSRLAAAAVFVQRGSLERQIADQGDRRISGVGFDPQAWNSTGSALATNRHVGAIVSVAMVLLLLAYIVAFLVWRDQRRPRKALATYGETHVESPLRWISTGAQRAAMAGLIVTSFLIGFQGRVVVGTPLADVPGKRLWAAVACLSWAGVWWMQIVQVRASERAYAERLAASFAARAGHVPVPVFAPVQKAGSNADMGEPEGALWVLRSAGLFMVGLISGLVLIGAIGEHSLEVVPYVAVAAPAFGLVVWAYVRRFQRKAERRSAQAQPQVTLTGYQ